MRGPTFARAVLRSRMPLNHALATFNAIVTTCTLVSLFLGYAAIRRRDVPRHRACMIAAFLFSVVFSITFVTRIVLFGLSEMHGSTIGRVLYYVIAASHDGLAVVNAPLAMVALATGLRRRFAAHRDVAKGTFFVWIYVGGTGLILYLVLYVL
jgi:putative membrane protein